MFSIIYAYLWEVWRLDRRQLLTTWSIVIGFGSLIIFMSKLFALENNQASVFAYGFAIVFAFANAGNTRFGEDQLGFPLTLGFTRPIPTALLALTPLFYLAFSRAAMFCVPVVFFNLVFATDFDLFPMVWRVFTVTVVLAVCFWWLSNTVLGYITLAVACLVFAFTRLQVYIDVITANGKNFVGPLLGLLNKPYSWQDFSYLAVWVVSASFVLVYGVSRERRGDKVLFASYNGQFLGAIYFQHWLICPTSSPLKAELWREFRVKGWPVMVAGIATALVISLSALLIKTFLPNEISLSSPIFDVFQISLLFLFMVSGTLVCLSVVANKVFDISQRRGVSTMSLFNATRAFTTSNLLSLKILSMSFWFTISFIIIFTSFWLNAALLSEFYGASSFSDFLWEPFNNRAWYDIAINVLVWGMNLATLVIVFGVFQAIIAVNAKTMSILGVGGIVGIIYTMAILNYSMNSDFPLLLLHAYSGLMLVIGAITYLLTVSFKDSILTIHKTIWLIVLWVIYAAVYLIYLANQEFFVVNPSSATIVWKVIVSLAPLLATLAAFRVFFLFRHQ